MIVQALKHSLVKLLAVLGVLFLSFVVLDTSDLDSEAKRLLNFAHFKQHLQQLIVEIPSAQARETRSERIARLKTEREARRRQESGEPEPNAAELSATPTITEEVVGNGPRKIEDDMVDFMDLPAVVETKAVVQEVEPSTDKLEPQQDGQKKRRRRSRERTSKRKTSEGADGQNVSTQQVMRGEVYSQLEEAQALYQNKDYAGALAILDKMAALTGRNALQSYEVANVWNFYAFIYYSKEDYPKAIKAYEKVLQQPDLPKAMVDKTQYTLAQLHMVREDYPAAIKAFKKWFVKAEKPGPDAHATLAQAYVQVKNYSAALGEMEKTMLAARDQGKRPKEQWYEVLRFLYNDKGAKKKELETVKVLLKYWPKKKYWLGLAGMYGEMGNTRKQMQILNALYYQNALDREAELISLAQMFAGAEVPYKAAKIMERGFSEKKVKRNNKNLERTGEYWRQAQEMEKALPLLETASKNAPDGKSSERLAYIYYSLSRFSESATAAKRALNKGGLRNADTLRMLVAQSLFNIQKFDEASTIFQRVSKQSTDETQRNMALQWLDYIEREKVRIQEVAQYLKS